MADLPTEAELAEWHRYFAVESNNRAWDLTLQSRTPAEDEDMLDAAHAAAWHWGFAGTQLHHMRARMLLAHVHALSGNGAIALSLANGMRAYFLAADTADWEIALTHAIHAHACLIAGDTDGHRESYKRAEQAIATISDEEDRKLVAQTFDLVPGADS